MCGARASRLEDGERAAALSPDDVLLLIADSVQQPVPPGGGYQFLLHRAVEVIAHLANDRRVPSALVREVFTHWLFVSTRSAHVLVEVLRARPGLLTGTELSAESQARLLDLLGSVDPRLLPAPLAACLPVLTAASVEAEAVEMIRAMPFATAIDVLSNPHTRAASRRVLKYRS